MAPISAFAAYKDIVKKDKKKKLKKENKVKSQKSIRNGKVDKKRPIVIPVSNSKSDDEEDEVLTYEQFITKGLEKLSRTDSTESIDGSYEEDQMSSDKNIVVGKSKVKHKKRKNSESGSSETTLSKKKTNNTNSRHPITENGNIKVKEKPNSGKETKSSSIAPNTKDVPETPSESPSKKNSIVEGQKAFEWIINPISIEDFFSTYWEQNTLLVKRENKEFYSSLISFEAIDQMLLDHHVEFTKNIDVTTYENGVRETHNPEGRALPPAVWDFYRDGCSVRLLNPQTFLKPLHELCATMQEYFHCLVGANAYLTPPNSQGFAPHYDDIEAFVLQVEGRKRWKVYSPRSPSEVLPRVSSRNFSQDEIGKPILEKVLEPGDLLYFPRGAIHQACTEPGYHSLHITLSVYQKQSYADLLEKMFPVILKNAIDSNVKLRRGLPLSIWRNAGLVYNEVDTQERASLEENVKKILSQCLHSVQQLSEVMDSAVDGLAKKFQHEALPPCISQAEKSHTIFGIRNQANECGNCPPKCPIELRTNVRLLRANILRLVSEEEQIRIYYYLDNSREYCEFEPNFFEIEPVLAGSVEVLVKSYPEFVSVSQLPLEDDESKIELVSCLWKRGLLMTEKPIRS